MRYLLVFIMAFFTTVSAPLYSQEKIRSIRLDISIIEMAEKNGKSYGIEQSALYSVLVEKFASNGIIVKNDQNLPYLVLQIKSLPTDNTIAMFLLGCFYQEATIVSSKRDIWAITWYQTSIIIGSKEKYTANIEQEAANIVHSFILDFKQKGIL